VCKCPEGSEPLIGAETLRLVVLERASIPINWDPENSSLEPHIPTNPESYARIAALARYTAHRRASPSMLTDEQIEKQYDIEMRSLRSRLPCRHSPMTQSAADLKTLAMTSDELHEAARAALPKHSKVIRRSRFDGHLCLTALYCIVEGGIYSYYF
jgi:hypothetical protein